MDNELDLWLCVKVEKSNVPLNWLFTEDKIKLGDKVWAKIDNDMLFVGIYNLDKSRIIGYMAEDIFNRNFQKLSDFRNKKINEILD